MRVVLTLLALACCPTVCVCVSVQVRVYVNGQLAGFSPIYYTMYTVSELQEEPARLQLCVK